MLLNTDKDKNINLVDEKVFFSRTHIAVGHRIQGGSSGPLRLKYAVDGLLTRYPADVHLEVVTVSGLHF